MSRRARDDLPGSWHHVINRAIARRPLFEDRHDVRYFLSRLAREVRRGRLEVHAWCILTTHFHLLVRSPTGELSEAIRRVQSESSRHYNRRHRRDGPLVRGRFQSKPVRSLAYRWNLVRYIDANAVRAGLVARPQDYPFGSAFHHARPSGPPWSVRDWIEQVVLDRVQFLSRASADSLAPPFDRNAGYQAGHYEVAFPVLSPGPAKRWLEARIDRGSGPDPLDRLVEGSPERIRRWLERKARLADGAPLGLPMCDAETILHVLKAEPWNVEGESGSTRPFRVELGNAIEVGLLRDLASLTWTEIARQSGTSVSTSCARYTGHRRLMACDQAYADRAGWVARRALKELHDEMVWASNSLGSTESQPILR